MPPEFWGLEENKVINDIDFLPSRSTMGTVTPYSFDECDPVPHPVATAVVWNVCSGCGSGATLTALEGKSEF